MLFVGTGGLGSLLLALLLCQKYKSNPKLLYITILDTSSSVITFWASVKKIFQNLQHSYNLGSKLYGIVCRNRGIKNYTRPAIDEGDFNDDEEKWDEFANQIFKSLSPCDGRKLKANQKLEILKDIIKRVVVSCTDWSEPGLEIIFPKMVGQFPIVLYPSNISSCEGKKQAKQICRTLCTAKELGALIIQTDLTDGLPTRYIVNQPDSIDSHVTPSALTLLMVLSYSCSRADVSTTESQSEYEKWQDRKDIQRRGSPTGVTSIFHEYPPSSIFNLKNVVYIRNDCDIDV